MSEATADTATDTTTTETTTVETQVTDTDTTDWAAEAEKWKAQARKHEERAKANANAAKELDKLKQEAMTEQERAVEQARQEARAEALREVGADRVDDAVRAALAGRDVDDDALLEGLDRSRFLDEDGQPDRDRIAAWVDRIAPKPTESTQDTGGGFVDLGQGARPAGSDALNGDPLLAGLKNKLGIN